MGQTHPNAYLAEATEKRSQANQLLAEADALEAKIKKPDTELPDTEEPAIVPVAEEDTNEEDSEEDSNEEQEEPTGPEDATSDEEDVHRHKVRRR